MDHRAWNKAGEIASWDGIDQVDKSHPDILPAFTPIRDGWEEIAGDWWLSGTCVTLALVVTWLTAELAFLSNVLPYGLRDALSVGGMLVLIGLVCQVGWAVIAARADDIHAGRKTTVRTFGRALRGSLFCALFAVVPAIFLSRLVSIVIPLHVPGVRLWLGRDGFEIPARYWHLIAGFKWSASNVSLLNVAELTVDCRSKVYDIAAEDSRRYRIGLVAGLTLFPLCLLAGKYWFQIEAIIALPLLIYLFVVIYYQAGAIVSLSSVFHKDYKRGKLEQSIAHLPHPQRQTYLVHSLYGLGYISLATIFVAIPVMGDVYRYESMKVDHVEIAARCVAQVQAKFGRAEIPAFAQDDCERTATDEQAKGRRHSVAETLRIYHDINKYGESPAFMRRARVAQGRMS